jgi:hypothetical protein
MKFIKKILIAAVVLAAFALHTDSFARARVTKKTGLAKQVKQTVAPVAEPIEDVEIVVSTEREKIEQAVIDTEKIKTAATLAINDANEQLAQGKMSHVDAAKIIGEQQYVIDQAKRQLAQLAGKSIEKVQDAENQESYLTQLFSGAQAAKAGLLEGIGYSSTAQQKAIAQAVIDELKKQLDSVSTDYAKKIEAASNPQDKAKLLQELDTIKRDIEKEIYRQQTITEDVMSTNKKLFWSAVGLAGAAVGAALAYQYLGTETPELGATIKDVPMPPSAKESSRDLIESLRIVEDENGNRQLMRIAPKDTTPTQTSIKQPETPSVPSTQGQPEIPQLPEVEPIPGIEDEQTEAPSTAQKMIETARNAASQAYGTIKGAAGTAYEKIKEIEDALGGPETPEEAAIRREGAKKMTQTPSLFPVQPPTKLSDAEQKALLQQEGEALGEFLLRPNLVPSERGELEVSPDVLPEYREGLMQSGGEVLTGAAKTIVDAEREMLTGARKTISDADLITEEDLSGVSLNPAKYQKSVESAGASIAGALGRAAEEQNRQVEEQIPSRLGTGGLTPSEYEERVAEGLKSTAETAAEILKKSAIEREKQEEKLIPSELGTGGLTPSKYRELVERRLESEKEKAIKSLRSATQEELEGMLSPKDYGNYRYERNRDLGQAQIEEIEELEKDWRLIQKQAELNNDQERLEFVNNLMGTIAEKLEREPGTTAQQYFDDTIKLREQFLKDVEKFDTTRPQAPKTQKQIEEGLKNKEAVQERLDATKARKKEHKDEGTQR